MHARTTAVVAYRCVASDRVCGYRFAHSVQRRRPLEAVLQLVFVKVSREVFGKVFGRVLGEFIRMLQIAKLYIKLKNNKIINQ